MYAINSLITVCKKTASVCLNTFFTEKFHISSKSRTLAWFFTNHLEEQH